MVIGEKLRSRRQEQNLSRNQLAEKIHVTPSAIANYENDISYPKPDTLIALMIALDMGIDLGLKELAICSDGKIFKNINKTKKVKKLEKRLKQKQRQISRKI